MKRAFLSAFLAARAPLQGDALPAKTQPAPSSISVSLFICNAMRSVICRGEPHLGESGKGNIYLLLFCFSLSILFSTGVPAHSYPMCCGKSSWVHRFIKFVNVLFKNIRSE